MSGTISRQRGEGIFLTVFVSPSFSNARRNCFGSKTVDMDLSLGKARGKERETKNAVKKERKGKRQLRTQQRTHAHNDTVSL